MLSALNVEAERAIHCLPLRCEQVDAVQALAGTVVRWASCGGGPCGDGFLGVWLAVFVEVGGGLGGGGCFVCRFCCPCRDEAGDNTHMRWLWIGVLASVAVVLAGAWVLFRFFVDLNQLAQLSGVGALAVGAAALVAAIWTAHHSRDSSWPRGDDIDQSGARAQGSVIGKSGPATTGGDRIHQRRARAGGDIIGQQHHIPDQPH